MTIGTKARQLLDRRFDALHTLTGALEKISEARRELDAREHQAWVAVTRAGWTDKDLSELGLTAPKRPRTPRKRGAAEQEPATARHEQSNQVNGDEHAA